MGVSQVAADGGLARGGAGHPPPQLSAPLHQLQLQVVGRPAVVSVEQEAVGARRLEVKGEGRVGADTPRGEAGEGGPRPLQQEHPAPRGRGGGDTPHAQDHQQRPPHRHERVKTERPPVSWSDDLTTARCILTQCQQT